MSINWKATALVLLLLIGGCGNLIATTAQEQMIGLSLPTAKAFLGFPTKEGPNGNGWLSEWDYSEAASNTQLPVADIATAATALAISMPISLASSGTVTLAGQGTCKLIAQALSENGIIVSVTYAGNAGGVSGPVAVCSSIVNGKFRMVPAMVTK